MNTKTVFKEKFIKDLIADYDNEKISLGKLVEILNEKIASPERGKEGKTAREVLKKHQEKYKGIKNNDSLNNHILNAMQEYAELYAQSTSKPVDNETSLEKILEKWGCKIFNEVVILDGLNLNQQDRFYNAIKEYHNMMCSKIPVEPKTRVTEDDYVIHGNDWDGYGIKYGNEVIVYVGRVADPYLAKIMIEKANQYISLNQESAEREVTKCDVCGCYPSVIITTEFGTFCNAHAKYT